MRQRPQGRNGKPFRYHDKGYLVTIRMAKAVADLPGIELTGFIAWLTWLFVHLFHLIGVQNRLVVFTRWSASFLTNGRSRPHHHRDWRQPTPARPRPRSDRA